jgi:hypothetical protein
MAYTDIEKRRSAARTWNARKRDELRVIIREAKAVPCKDCQVSYPYYVMHFDHVRGVKVRNISRMVQQPSAQSLEDLLLEIDKCEVICANCHALRHGGSGTDERE